MVIKEFDNLKEMKRYYHKETNSYIFKEDGKYFDLVKFNFDLSIEANICANDIEARHIICSDINACDIDAWNITARNIIACNITANDINAGHINANNIDANNIDTWSINANSISYWAVCFACRDIKCRSIEGKRKIHKHFVLDGKLEVKDK